MTALTRWTLSRTRGIGRTYEGSFSAITRNFIVKRCESQIDPTVGIEPPVAVLSQRHLTISVAGPK